jgi:hypothetical protein
MANKVIVPSTCLALFKFPDSSRFRSSRSAVDGQGVLGTGVVATGIDEFTVIVAF